MVRGEADGKGDWAMRLYQVYLVSVMFVCVLCDAGI